MPTLNEELWTMFAAPLARPDLVTKHLAGTEFDHDQSTHARGGGGSLGKTRLSKQQLAEFRGGSAEAHLFTGPDGVTRFTPEREKLHNDFIRNALEGVERSADPTLFMLGGGTASGKSTMLASDAVDVPEGNKAVLVDADKAKFALPEYRSMIASNDINAAPFAHEESSYLAKRVQRAAYLRGFDVVLDGTGDGTVQALTAKIEEARSNGYKVNGFYVTVPIDVAIERSNARAMADGPDKGRFVYPDFIEGIHRRVSEVFPTAAQRMDRIVLYDNTTTLKLIFEASDGTVVFVDESSYDQFLRKGQ